MADTAFGPARAIPPAEVEDVDLYHAKSWVTKYIFSQDAKVIAIQYAVTATAIGLVALVLSWLMRLQLGFPGRFAFIDPSHYLQFITMHGMIMVVYLLTALFLGGFGNYLIPLMGGCTALNPYERLWGGSGELKELEEEIRVPAGGFAPRFHAAVGCIGPDQPEREAAHDGHVARPVAAVARQVLLERHVQEPVHALHSPVAAHRLSQPCDVERGGGDVVVRVEGTAIGMLGAPVHLD